MYLFGFYRILKSQKLSHFTSLCLINNNYVSMKDIVLLEGFQV